MAHLAPSKHVVAALSLLVVGLMSCSGEWITVAATDPLDHIVISPLGEAFVHAKPGVELQELVSTEPFVEMGLRPGMTAKEAASLIGPPDFAITEQHGQVEVFGYRSSGGVFEIVKQHVASEGTEVDRWFLRYRPTECMKLVDPVLLGQLRSLQPFPEQATVFAEPNQEGVVKIEFESDRSCSKVWWLQETRPAARME